MKIFFLTILSGITSYLAKISGNPQGGSPLGLQTISAETLLLVHTVCFINLNKILLVRVQEMPSQNQLKSQILFHKNSSPRDLQYNDFG